MTYIYDLLVNHNGNQVGQFTHQTSNHVQWLYDNQIQFYKDKGYSFRGYINHGPDHAGQLWGDRDNLVRITISPTST